MFSQLPKVTKILFWVNVGMFVVQFLVGLSGGALAPLMLWPIGGVDLIGNPISSQLGNFLPWQLVTYAFLHADIVHLSFNMLGLVMFAAPLEYTWGTKRFTTYYFVCVVGGGLTYIAWSALMHLSVPVLGASGGIFGLLLAYGMLYPKQKVMLLIPPIPMDARMLVIVYGAIELLYVVTGTGGGVAHFAHLGGMLFGWLMIRYWRGQLPFKRRRRPPPPPPPKFKIVR